MDFNQAFAELIDGRREGRRLSMDPNDRGNWTGGQVGLGTLRGSKFGISAAQYPGEDIENITLERAKAIYARDYWGPAGCDAAPDAAKFDLFDMAVNSGPAQAIKTLQRAVGATPDGILGAQTLQAIQSMPGPRFVARFNGARLSFLTSLGNWPSFSRGWCNRIAANLLDA